MAERIPNKQYNLAAPNSLPVRLSGYQRRHMYARFILETGVDATDTILDAGVTADRSYAIQRQQPTCVGVCTHDSSRKRFTSSLWRTSKGKFTMPLSDLESQAEHIGVISRTRADQ